MTLIRCLKMTIDANYTTKSFGICGIDQRLKHSCILRATAVAHLIEKSRVPLITDMFNRS